MQSCAYVSRFNRIFVFLVMTIALNGCLQIEYAVDIAPNFSANIRALFNFNPLLYEGIRSQNPESLNDICKSGVTSSENDRIQYVMGYRGNFFTCEIRIYIDNILKPSSLATATLSNLEISVKPDGFLKYVVRISTSLGVNVSDDDKLLLSGQYFTAVVRGSKIISSNSQVTDDYTASYVKVPMASYLSSEAGKYALVVEAEGKPRWWPF
jgi:hypothetical protein